MDNLVEKLFSLADRLDGASKNASSPTVMLPLDKVVEAANNVGKSWGGSWLGHYSQVYYEDLQPPPPGVHFNETFGLGSLMGEQESNWCEYRAEDVRKHIFSMAGVKTTIKFKQIETAKEMFENGREELLSVMAIAEEDGKDSFLSRLKKDVEGKKLFGVTECLKALRPSQVFSNDYAAMAQGLRVPPHIQVLAEIFALKQPAQGCDELEKLARRAASHIETRAKRETESQRIGTNVFIGHGQSKLWKDLKDFIQDRLVLPWDEFSRVPVAGVTNTARLAQMLDSAAIALLVMTAEDEQADGKIHARMNVIHEAGLFQGRLGFTKAIVLLEEGCEEFSNIQGLGQIRFPKGDIARAFEEVRRVLEREGLIEQ
jgi:predicted nucleotide-binding protein